MKLDIHILIEKFKKFLSDFEDTPLKGKIIDSCSVLK